VTRDELRKIPERCDGEGMNVQTRIGWEEMVFGT
jgi:hypothetical protein